MVNICVAWMLRLELAGDQDEEMQEERGDLWMDGVEEDVVLGGVRGCGSGGSR